MTPTWTPVAAEAFVEHDLQRRGEPADVGGVARGVHLDLQAPRALGRVVGGRLGDDPPHGGLGAHDRACGVVGPLEPEPAALVGGNAQRHVVRQSGGQAHALLGRQLDERADPHRAREVQVQVSLREKTQVAHRHIMPGHGGRPDARRLPWRAAPPGPQVVVR
jgi:hypothetical protein